MNRGDPQNGWDTDQFPNDLRELTTALYYIMRAGGFTTGGINFDAKVRRQSIDAEDLFHGHVGAIDLIARALLCAETLMQSGAIESFLRTRYQGWETPLGRSILGGELSLAQLSEKAERAERGPTPRSGKQEWLENLVSAALR
jgi:xylose isomerase